MIEADSVAYAYDEQLVLRDVTLAARRGEVVGLIGPNGSGKTTLLRTLYAGLDPQGGTVLLDGRSVADLGRRRVARELAVVVQEASGDLPLTVAEMVLLGRAPHLAGFQRPRAEDHRIAAAALHRVGARHLAERSFAGLSGGEKQRVLIARALAQQAQHLLLDEPTNHLDIRYQHEVLQLVASLDVTTVVVLHDLNLAGRYCDRLVLLDAGRVVATGPTDEVLRGDVLEPVYGIGVERLVSGDLVQLLFHPLPEGRDDPHADQRPDDPVHGDPQHADADQPTREPA